MVVEAMLGRLPEERNPFSLARFSRPGGMAPRKPL